MYAVFNYCDETVVLSHGKIVYHGSTLDLFADDDKLNEFNMLKPQIVELRNALINKGFKISKQARTIEDLVKEVKGQLKK